jgi:hypothetical protein
VVETKLESLFCRLGCHQTRTLKGPLAIFQTVSEEVFSETGLPTAYVQVVA